MQRRQFLAFLSASTLSGCFGGPRRSIRLGTLVVSNRDETQHTLDVRIEADETVVFDRTVSLTGARSDDTDSADQSAPSKSWDRVANTAGLYRVHVRLDGGEWRETDLSLLRRECVDLLVVADADGVADLTHLSCGAL
ncbi:hypothetical protein AUR64_00895 [Haloprofundus marisrubri]|uniref:Uncharacterized protein n=1 Tax=Haloprofundus marisrubri TaxID=1514971 RepID=A0A0W1R4C4_9EURY|nr:hypothetical protein [Haloprofundus marisrubri]KTG08163.1 hypothetical protein AUR64_00895 [Haloprofundus marisrubri]